MNNICIAIAFIATIYIIFVSTTDADTRNLEAKTKAVDSITKLLQVVDEKHFSADLKKELYNFIKDSEVRK